MNFQDDIAFVFSLDKTKIYPIKKGKEAIRCCSCCYPRFYSSTIYLKHNFSSRIDNYVSTKEDNYEGFTKDYELKWKKNI